MSKFLKNKHNEKQKRRFFKKYVKALNFRIKLKKIVKSSRMLSKLIIKSRK